ncbi:chromosome condensation complex protein [Laccaria bicolor S238N-H82]|uniref:Condensin complex subunit 1 n=1 Tax=Laccaria bicolor (strain S238N-H82 / ATCC MYA-4686) TaxID=486041 RepID=B0DPE7_LACBS|nr:chromosome condensation complex protein [Laccaria bicolor S238N-H82]EDR03670.1 chromosome condensation complex protein [Laccaria bicolor S238N-H82]|eukprot:XP_001885818.1 chromosome condensation complex protein [Laccaria bicolor S238N-H82]
MSKLLDSISSGLLAELEATMRDVELGDQQSYMAHKTPLELYAFLLQWFVTAAEKVKATEDGDAPPPAAATKGRRGRGGKAGAGRGAGRGAASKKNEAWTWQDQIPATLGLIVKVLRLQTQRIWTTTAEREDFIKTITRPAYHVAENEQYMKKSDIKLWVYKVICLSVKHHGQSFAVHINIIQFLTFFEHLSEPMAECLTVLAGEYDHAQVGDEILRDIAGKTFNAQDSKGPRAFARFLVKFAELAPRAILKQLSLLLDQLDSESYPMRQALVEVIGSIITELSNTSTDNDNSKTAQKQISGLFDLLLERTLDISSYVRTKLLQVLAKMCDLKPKFPKQRLAITGAAIAALADKGATVRKTAAALLVKLLETHPYRTHGGMLQLDVWQAEYQDVCKELEKIEGKIGNADEDDAKMAVDDDDENATPKKKPKKKKKHSKLKPRKSQLNVAAVTEEQAVLAGLEGQELQLMNLRKKYFVEGLAFIRQIESAMEPMGLLLGSKNKLEVAEAIEFFKVAHDYEFESAKVGIRKMLHLIWVKDNNNSGPAEEAKEGKGVRQKLLDCYRGLYFEAIEGLQPKEQVSRIAKNLVERTYETTLAELTSLEEMMRIMSEEEQIHQDVISKLWQIYSSKQNIPSQQRRGAIIILGMLALGRRSVLSDRVDTLLKVGLGSLGKADLTLARYTCVALQRLNGSAKKVKGSLLDKTMRIEMTNPIFRKLQDAVNHPCRSREWFGFAEQVINTVYALGEHPDVFCNELIKKFTIKAFTPRAPKPATDPDAMAEDHPGDVTQNSLETATQDSTPGTQQGDKEKDVGDAFELSQLLFIVGHVAIKQIVFLELVEREWKRQKDEKQAGRCLIPEKLAAKAKGTDKASKDGEELDQVAGNAEDEIGDRVAGVRETEMLYGTDSLLAMYGPMVVHICGSPHKFKSPTLRAAATLLFSKFLCVSSQFCDQNHRLLFKILETSKDANIRSNIVIALGDVAVSFSNIIDENSNELYKGLSDGSIIVKKNTLMVLTHLILNGMIKVKGQLGEMAKCVEDEDARIADLAKLFFSELSTKENAIYNNLPDGNHLSTGDHAVDEKTFRSTLQYIFTFIEKEKQAENIVEKLCQRFRLSEDPRQWRDIAFCLSLLPFKSERSVKKLIEGFQFYRDKLHEPQVYEKFTEILAKVRSFEQFSGL